MAHQNFHWNYCNRCGFWPFCFLLASRLPSPSLMHSLLSVSLAPVYQMWWHCHLLTPLLQHIICFRKFTFVFYCCWSIIMILRSPYVDVEHHWYWLFSAKIIALLVWYLSETISLFFCLNYRRPHSKCQHHISWRFTIWKNALHASKIVYISFTRSLHMSKAQYDNKKQIYRVKTKIRNDSWQLRMQFGKFIPRGGIVKYEQTDDENKKRSGSKRKKRVREKIIIVTITVIEYGI